jgi:predicted nucleotidyltransferase
MADPVSGNLAMLMRVVDRLAPLLDRFVFLGGVVTELLITSAAAGSPRQTKDVDVVVNALNLGEYSETLRERFLACGLVEDTSPGAPVCRWCLDDLIVDIMPTRGEILDFSCEWYQVAFDTAQPTMLPNGSMIRLVTPACFLATKLAAFGDRGRRDPMASHDLEDLVSVIDGRREIVADLAAAPRDLRTYVAERLSHFLARGDADVLLAAQLMPDSDSQDRLPFVVDRIRSLITAGNAS